MVAAQTRGLIKDPHPVNLDCAIRRQARLSLATEPEEAQLEAAHVSKFPYESKCSLLSLVAHGLDLLGRGLHHIVAGRALDSVLVRIVIDDRQRAAEVVKWRRR